MDIGELIFLLLIGFGFISSLLGGNKKTKAPPRPRAERPPPPPAKVRGTAMDQMERLLEELQLRAGGEPPRRAPAAAVETDEPDVVEVESYDDIYEELEEPVAYPQAGAPPIPSDLAEPSLPSLQDIPTPPYRVPLERPLPPPTRPVDAASHKAFHERYVEPGASMRRRVRKRFRVRQYLRAETLREAVLLREILGPPKGLR